jgi:hypothetical protein
MHQQKDISGIELTFLAPSLSSAIQATLRGGGSYRTSLKPLSDDLRVILTLSARLGGTTEKVRKEGDNTRL